MLRSTIKQISEQPDPLSVLDQNNQYEDEGLGEEEEDVEQLLWEVLMGRTSRRQQVKKCT